MITALGLMVGLHAGTHSRLAVIGGIVTIAVADALSDALGIHIAEESRNNGSMSEIWESTIATFVAKFLIAMTFVVLVLMLPLEKAMMASVVWGLSLLAVQLHPRASTANFRLDSHCGAFGHWCQRDCDHPLRGHLDSFHVELAEC